MINVWVPALVLATGFLLSCDPSRRIEMVNKTNDTVEIVWKSKEDSIGLNPFVLNNKKKLEFVLPPEKGSEMKLSFGIGTWSPEEVEKAIHLLEYFEINSPSQHLRIDSMPLLKTWLLERRKGFGKSKIVIVVGK